MAFLSERNLSSKSALSPLTRALETAATNHGRSEFVSFGTEFFRFESSGLSDQPSPTTQMTLGDRSSQLHFSTNFSSLKELAN